MLVGLRPGNRPGGERHSRSGEGGRGEDADVAGAGAAGVGRDEQSRVERRVVLAVLGLFKLRCAVKPRVRRWGAWRASTLRPAV